MNDKGSFFNLINFLLVTLGGQIQELGLERVSLNEDAYDVLGDILTGRYVEKEEKDEKAEKKDEKVENVDEKAEKDEDEVDYS